MDFFWEFKKKKIKSAKHIPDVTYLICDASVIGCSIATVNIHTQIGGGVQSTIRTLSSVMGIQNKIRILSFVWCAIIFVCISVKMSVIILSLICLQRFKLIYMYIYVCQVWFPPFLTEIDCNSQKLTGLKSIRSTSNQCDPSAVIL